MKRLRVGILFGGRSTEHEVSIMSAKNVLAGLDRDRFEPVLIGIDHDGRWLVQEEAALLAQRQHPHLVEVIASSELAPFAPRPGGADHRDVDVVFPVLHGPLGEDGTVQGLLDLAEIPYVGSGVLGSSVCMDKDMMKRVLRGAGLPVVEFDVVRAWELDRDPDAVASRAAELQFPQYVKPANQGSSVGVSRVADPSELDAALRLAFRFDTKALIERAVTAREIECSVLGNDEPIASVPGEVIVESAHGFYSYEAKYVDETGAVLVIPADLPDSTAAEVQRLAVDAFVALECSGLARVDFFVDTTGRALINELNTIPGFTDISMYPRLWTATGVSTTELITRLIDLALDRHATRAALIRTAELPSRDE